MLPLDALLGCLLPISLLPMQLQAWDPSIDPAAEMPLHPTDNDTTASELRLAVVGGVEAPALIDPSMLLLAWLLPLSPRNDAVDDDNAMVPLLRRSTCCHGVDSMASLCPMTSLSMAKIVCQPRLMISSMTMARPLTPSALATVKSIFHCAHPVVSRPAVPNINVFCLSGQQSGSTMLMVPALTCQ